MKHQEIIEYFDALPPDTEFEITVSDRFPIAPFQHGDLLTLLLDIDIVAGNTYLVVYKGQMFAARAKLLNGVLALTDFAENSYHFTEDHADCVAVLARILSVTFY